MLAQDDVRPLNALHEPASRHSQPFVVGKVAMFQSPVEGEDHRNVHTACQSSGQTP